MELFLFGGAIIVFFSILVTPISSKIGAPLLLLFLVLGMLLGEDGPGRIDFNNFNLAYNLGSMALAIILFAGGLDTPKADIRKAAAPAFVLATLGVMMTSAIVGGIAALLGGVSLIHGLLLGAVVGSTDAAATFLLLKQSKIKLSGRVRETILVESGLNDPMAIFLTTTFVVLVDSGVTSLTWSTAGDLLPALFQQLGAGALAGVLGGFGLAWFVNVTRIPSGLYPPFALAGALVIFSTTQLLDGSGFLAIYLCGIIIADRIKRPVDRLAHFHEGLAWLSQIMMFLMLGLLVSPHQLGETFLHALALAAFLMFVARPVAVFLCLWPFGFSRRQQIYIGWVGLRGAVPIFLAIIPVISPGPVSVEFFNIVFVIVIASLVLQGWTLSPAAKWLKVTAEHEPEPKPPEIEASTADESVEAEKKDVSMEPRYE